MRAPRDPVQAPRDIACEERPRRRAVRLRAGHVFARLVHHRVVMEDEVVLGRDHDAAERWVRGVEPGVQQPNAHAGGIDAFIGERADVQLAVRHLRRAEDRVTAGCDSARIAGPRQRDPRHEIESGTSQPRGRGPQLEASQRLDAAQVAVLEELTKRGRWCVGADRVQPAAADAHTRSGRGHAIADVSERRDRTREEPD